MERVFNKGSDRIEVKKFSKEFDSGDKKEFYNIKGKAAVFNKDSKGFEFEEGKMMYDVIDKDAFNDAKFNHVVLNLNHDMNYPIAVYREGQENNSLEFSVEEDGIYYEAEVDAGDVDVQRIVRKIENGIFFENSFACLFSFGHGDMDFEEDKEGNIRRYWRKALEVIDFSIVTSGNFSETDLVYNSRDKINEEIKNRSLKESLEVEFKKAEIRNEMKDLKGRFDV